MKKIGTFEQCTFCGTFSEFVGILENAKNNETYCPFCMTTQKQARKKVKISACSSDWESVGLTNRGS